MQKYLKTTAVVLALLALALTAGLVGQGLPPPEESAPVPLLKYDEESFDLDSGTTKSLVVSEDGGVRYTVRVSSISSSSSEDNRARSYKTTLTPEETESLVALLNRKSIRSLSAKFESKNALPFKRNLVILITRGNEKQNIHIIRFSPQLNHYPPGLLDLMEKIDRLAEKTVGSSASESSKKNE